MHNLKRIPYFTEINKFSKETTNSRKNPKTLSEIHKFPEDGSNSQKNPEVLRKMQ